jgi:hypothetical protein
MYTLAQAYDLDNLSQAWLWVRSNPDPAYKKYFRALYKNYAVADAELLYDLNNRLRRGIYEPAAACKVFLPKASGLLRPVTLLTVEDQIVYQALVNIVADRLHPRVKHRYGKEVFSHLLAGKASTWFYQKWQHAYARFNQAARRAFAEGFVFTARFDLTAFYDSLDHGVLRHFIEVLRCDHDYLDLLERCLNKWTSMQGSIYHKHGIPQRPLSSGLLSEVVLQHFDRRHNSPATVRYLRYVDDIRLFSTSLTDLRRVVTWLDLLSKEVGLFPQSSKIDIHPVTDIEEELKSVSEPFQDVLDPDRNEVDQEKLRGRLLECSKRLKIQDPTEFKFLLAHARPTAELNDRLWRLLEHYPEFAENILRYFQGYDQLPRRAGEKLVAALKARPRFPSVVSELLHTAEGRLAEKQLDQVDTFVNETLSDDSPPGSDYQAATLTWAIRRGLLPSRLIPGRITRLSAWWVKAMALAALEASSMREEAKARLLNTFLSAGVSDEAIGGAVQIALENLSLTAKVREMHRAAACVLERFRLIRRDSVRVCGIRRYFEELLGEKTPSIDWRTLFGRRYRRVEQQAVMCRACARTDVTAWVNAMDVFNDFLLDALFRDDPSMGSYSLGGIGSILSCGALRANYPATVRLMTEIHEKRSESALSHPVKTKGKARVVVKPTGRIKFGYIRRGKKFVLAALQELAGKKKW